MEKIITKEYHVFCCCIVFPSHTPPHSPVNSASLAAFLSSSLVFVLFLQQVEALPALYQKSELRIPMKLRGLVPNSYIHVSVSNLHIPTIGLTIRLQQMDPGNI
jgi:hypothetical protein